MAVYTHVSAEQMAELLSQYDLGQLVSAKGIAEGIENSNFMVDTDQTRVFLTLYEKRVDPEQLPFFLHLLDHLADKGCHVPRFLSDRNGDQIQQVAGRPACVIEFLNGVSASVPTPIQANSVGLALGEMHGALVDFDGTRPNSMNLAAWHDLAKKCGAEALNEIAPNLSKVIADELNHLNAHWPKHLPTSIIHADLFPDNVLMLNDKVTGLIDFYFSCTDIRAFDVAITHAAWCFSADGSEYSEEVSQSLLQGYETSFGLSKEEQVALPILARGASLRFLLTRCFDWINTPADALVTRKDPMAFLRRLEFYSDPANETVFDR